MLRHSNNNSHTKLDRVNKLKVLHVYKDCYPPVKGGIENHINILTNGLKARGVDIRLLVANTRNNYQVCTNNGIRIAKAPQWGRFYSAPLTPSLFWYLKRFGQAADIVHFHHPNPTAEFSYLLTNLKKKLVITYHSDIIRQDKLGKLYSPFRKMFLEASDKIIATSPNYIHTSNILKNFKNKCTVIPLGINVERFKDNGHPSRMEKIKRRHNHLPIILFVGRFRYYKGLHLLIPAMKMVPARLLLIGTGPEEKRLKELVEKNDLKSKIIFLGEIPDEDVNDYYKACDIFVLPSHLRSEAFGIVQIEAMCCGKPVISTELGTGTSFVNIDQKTGLTVRPNDVEELANALNHLIEHPEKRAAMGACAAQRVRQLFASDGMIEKTLNLYRELTGQ